MFANVKAGVKLGIGFGVAVLILMAVGVFSYGNFQQTNAQRAVFEKNDIAKKILLIRGNRAFGDAIDHFKNYVLRGGEYDLKFASDIEAIRKITDHYRKLSDVSGNEKVLLDEIDSAANAYLAAMNQLAGMRAEGKRIEEMYRSIQGPDKPIYNALQQLEDAVAKDAAGATSRFGALLDRANLITAFLLAFALAITVLLATFITLSIVRPVRRALEAPSSSEELAVTAEKRSGQAEILQQLVGFFRFGSDTPAPGARRSGNNWDSPVAEARLAITRAMAPSLVHENHFQRF